MSKPSKSLNQMSLKPMLATVCEDFSTLTYPLYASPKLDGIRCLMIQGKAFSRSLKPIPNRYIQSQLAGLHGLDGELMIGETFQAVTSGVMSIDGEPDFTYHVFDSWESPQVEYTKRLDPYLTLLNPRVKWLYQELVQSPEELQAIVDKHITEGFEGTMVRSPTGIYKYGRSTLREGFLLKIKPFEDAEAEVIGFYEQEQNLNEPTTSELGLSKRSSHQANKQGKNTLGGFHVTSPVFGEFNIGTGLGLTQALRQEIWDNQPAYLNKLVKFRYQAFGTKDKPRAPIFLGFRSKFDL